MWASHCSRVVEDEATNSRSVFTVLCVICRSDHAGKPIPLPLVGGEEELRMRRERAEKELSEARMHQRQYSQGSAMDDEDTFHDLDVPGMETPRRCELETTVSFLRDHPHDRPPQASRPLSHCPYQQSNYNKCPPSWETTVHVLWVVS